jgi:hypothetical protein
MLPASPVLCWNLLGRPGATTGGLDKRPALNDWRRGRAGVNPSQNGGNARSTPVCGRINTSEFCNERVNTLAENSLADNTFTASIEVTY